MPSSPINGAQTPTGGSYFSSAGFVYNSTTSAPQGREVLGGNRPILITAAVIYLGGRGGSRSASVNIAGTNSTEFTVAAEGNIDYSAYAGFFPSGVGVANGGSIQLGFNTSGAMNFGRASNGSINIISTAGGSFTDRTLSGYFDYVVAPAAPGTPVIADATTSGAVNVSWAAPDNGGTAITDYTLQWSESSTFASGVAQTVGITGTSRTVTGLTPGAVYYFRLTASNAASNVAGSSSLWSGTGSIRVRSGLKVLRSGVYRDSTVYVNRGGAYVPAEVFVKRSGVYVRPTT